MIPAHWLRPAALIALLCIAAPALAQTTRTWTGAVDNRWSVAGNWAPAVVPVAGDSLEFPFDAQNRSTTNDLPVGTRLHRVRTTGSDYTLNGNGVELAESFNGAWGTRVNLPIDVASHEVVLSGVAVLAGELSGTGPVQVSGITFSGTHSYSGTMTALGVVTLDQADFSQATLVVQGVLQGSGVVGPLTWLGGDVRPDNDGIESGDLLGSGWGNLSIMIYGEGTEASYGQLRVSGGVELGNSKSLSISLSALVVPVVGQEWVLIDNDGVDPIIGSFSNLPEGSIILHQGAELLLSYTGGDGNDLSLTCISAPKVWGGSASVLWSEPGNWVPEGVPVSGESLWFSDGASNRSMVNDLPAGTAFSSIEVWATGYSLSGNRIELTDRFRGWWSGTQVHLPIDVAGNAVTFTGSLGLAGELSGSGPVHVDGNVTVSGAHSYDGVMDVTGTLVLDEADLSLASLVLQGQLYGSGTVGPVNWTGWRINLYLGRITTGDMSASGSGQLVVQIDGTDPGQTYGQLRVAGSVDLGTDKNVYTNFDNSLVPVVGQEWVLIDNEGSDPIIGAFSNLPDGSIIIHNGAELLVSYSGGDGNDLSLTCISAPRVWNGSVGVLWSLPGNWTPAGVPMPGESLRFPSGATNLNTTNDLPEGTAFASVDVLSTGYTLGGNRIELTERFSGWWNTQVDLPIDVAGNAVTLSGAGTLAGEFSGTGPVLLNGPMFAGTHSYSGTMTSQGQLMLNQADLSQATLVLQGTLSGSGTLGPVVWKGATIHTGPGRIDTGDITASEWGTLYLQLNGTEPGVSHGQLRVAGSVDLGTSKGLSLSFGINLFPVLGQELVLIDNDGSDPIVGTFFNMPEGAIIAHNGAELRVSYKGGDGNDFSLTCISTSRVWNGSVDNRWSVAGNWTPSGVPLAGDNLRFPHSAVNRSTTNDLPSGTPFNRIEIAGSSYTLNGNGIELVDRFTGSSWAQVNLPIDVAGHSVRFLGSSTSLRGELTGTGSIVVEGEFSLSGAHSYSGNLTVEGELLLLDADLSHAVLSVSGALKGNGSVGTVNWLAGGQLGPGTASLSTADVTGSAWGDLRIEVAGTLPGISLGQLHVAGAVELGTSKTLSLQTAFNFVPALGQELVLIDNDGSDPVAGAFGGRPEGATVAVGSFNYRLSYVGGDGNDVTLTSLNGRQPTSTSLVATPNPSQTGQWVTLTASVAGGSQVPSGQVVFRDGRDVMTTVNLDVSGTAVLTTNALQPGSRSLTAEYLGGPNHGASASGALTQTVGALHTLTYTAGPNGSLVGASVQQVIEGTDGSPVTAVPDIGYSFLQWSDASTDNPRVDTQVTESLSVEAQFAIIPDTVELQIAKDSGLHSALDGQVVVYAITVANAGPVAASGAQLSDVLPAELVDGEWACLPVESNAACPPPPFDAGSGDLHAEIDLPVGGFLRYDLSARIQAGGAAVVSNTASVVPPAGLSDLNPGNNSATSEVLIEPQGIFAHGFEAGPALLTVPAAAKAQREASER